MSGTHRDLLFGSKSRCFASKNHTWGLGPMETSDSDANHAVLQAKTTEEGWNQYRLDILVQIRPFLIAQKFGMQKPQMRTGTHRDFKFWSKMRCFACKNHRWGLGHIETSNSDAKVPVFHAQNDSFCLRLLETCYSGPKVAALHPKTTHEGWDP